jgi:hypothetical protein
VYGRTLRVFEVTVSDANPNNPGFIDGGSLALGKSESTCI